MLNNTKYNLQNLWSKKISSLWKTDEIILTILIINGIVVMFIKAVFIFYWYTTFLYMYICIKKFHNTE